MSNKLNNNELKAIGIKDEALLEVAGRLAKSLIKNKTYTKEALLAFYKELLKNPDSYTSNELFAELAEEVKSRASLFKKSQAIVQTFELRTDTLAYPIYGTEHISDDAKHQMNAAMQLPVAVAGALMPDAHSGYGLPIGGVLATEPNIIIPYAVGVDIACRMCLSVFDVNAIFLDQKTKLLKQHLLDHTYFGLDGENRDQLSDTIFDLPEWKSTAQIRQLRYKAEKQLGTSGTGNHFVEWGILDITEQTPELKLPKGKYLALLSHSGSRGFGANIATHYSKIATEKTKLPREAQHLAWLDLNTEEGQEYWIGMNLAGDYASACHHQIHRRLAQAIGSKPIAMIENHHNFAWKETLADGREVMVHRKGATPAGKGVMGIIPGSMTQPGFVVRGKGDSSSICSASHGAGRLLSRSKALKTITRPELKQVLADKGVTLIGGDLDEAPMVYKDINQVMSYQNDLVEVLARFTPKIVRMADPDKRTKGWEG
ncbi:RtcB family protein [Xanthocytophaga flava]|uniref:RtcB family protein n=1 Tax=Xanthocytophaga flava TaxID=3048013 RepID=UPI0028D54E4F|nr:RtcB family protein [Xanthocytophaga flavus]MDJ1468303.1 RtcB family protein [Xanthocytophaga flavus]